MTDTDTAAARDGRGRFQPGVSGNPAGKKPGTLNHATRLKRSLEDEAGDFEAAARGIAARARKGEFAAARFLVDRLDPKPRGRPIELEFPEDASPVERFARVTRAMAAGEITPDEALVVVRVLEAEDRARERAAAPQKTTPKQTLDEAHAAGDRAGERVFGRQAAAPLHPTCNSEPSVPPAWQPAWQPDAPPGAGARDWRSSVSRTALMAAGPAFGLHPSIARTAAAAVAARR